ncbi:hypothetical protein ACHAW5_007627 [Stephanodiscus triporus]|uniref:Uncharacterized protein n=1 Tax=Stephanodiscus triporus TaxID=2934178 RepID=A0ABD3PGM1_9STRA
MMSTSFSGFNNLVGLCRANTDDGWNAVLGSALAGTSGGNEEGRGDLRLPSSSTTLQGLSEFMCTDLPLDDDYYDGAF